MTQKVAKACVYQYSLFKSFHFRCIFPFRLPGIADSRCPACIFCGCAAYPCIPWLKLFGPLMKRMLRIRWTTIHEEYRWVNQAVVRQVERIAGSLQRHEELKWPAPSYMWLAILNAQTSKPSIKTFCPVPGIYHLLHFRRSVGPHRYRVSPEPFAACARWLGF